MPTERNSDDADPGETDPGTAAVAAEIVGTMLGVSATHVLLVRHAVTAETGALLSGRKAGIDLSEEGRRQAAHVGTRLAVLPIQVIYASPIERTTQTAAAIAAHHGLDVRPCPGMIEVEYGEWTGGRLADLAKTDLWKRVQAAPSAVRFPGGETIREMQARAVATIDGLVEQHPGEMIVVVSHADVIKAATAHYSGVHLDLFQRIVVSPASVTALMFTSFGPMVVKMNDSGSLDELKPPPPKEPEQPEPEQSDGATANHPEPTTPEPVADAGNA